jgi:hypothetical protein
LTVLPFLRGSLPSPESTTNTLRNAILTEEEDDLAKGGDSADIARSRKC